MSGMIIQLTVEEEDLFLDRRYAVHKFMGLGLCGGEGGNQMLKSNQIVSLHDRLLSFISVCHQTY